MFQSGLGESEAESCVAIIAQSLFWMILYFCKIGVTINSCFCSKKSLLYFKYDVKYNIYLVNTGPQAFVNPHIHVSNPALAFHES